MLGYGRTLSCVLVLSATNHPSPAQTSATVNAPVAPDAIYVGRSGANAGLSVIDLNGFGAATGNPAYSLRRPIRPGNSNFPNNPNVSLQGAALQPALFPGTTTVDGGSSGVFGLTRNADLGEVLYGGDHHLVLLDLMLGHPLSRGAAAMPGNVCADPARQIVRMALSGRGTLEPARGSRRAIHSYVGEGNPISWAPHPNPPPLDPLTLAAAEPTSITSRLGGYVNLLAPGPNFLGDPAILLPPTNMLAREQNAFYEGPGAPELDPADCPTYMLRQPVGHYLYALERTSGALLVLDSNRMTELTRIPCGDPAELAMSPELTHLAITDRASDSVLFVDIDPRSPAVHTVVHVTAVGDAPSGIAWEPGNEDILVCNEGSGSISILSAATLAVRKTLSGLDRPFALAITPRQDGFGLERGVYFAYLLERSGHVLVYESGPDGVSGIGYDDVILRSSFRLLGPRAIQADPTRLSSGAWIAHRGWIAGDGGVYRRPSLTEVVLTGLLGPMPIDAAPPHPRELALGVARSIGPDELTGQPLDLAFDDQVNLGALPNHHTAYSAGTPAVANGKNLVRAVPGLGLRATNSPSYLFVPTRSRAGGQVDVIDLVAGVRVDTNPFLPGVQSIPVAGAARVMGYFRQ
jgi:YVTN family beta-propeller protein